MPDLDAALAEKIAGWDCWSRRRLRNTVDAAILRADPEAAKERRHSADTDRRVTVRAEPNGMARVQAQISAPAAALFDQRLSAMATAVCAEDPRTLAQRRADALEALGRGRFTLDCGCGRPECPARAADPPGPGRVVINVVASADTLTGRSEDPGYLDGYGVLDAEQVRDLADGGALLRPTARPSDPQAGDVLRHQPCAALARWVRCRDLTCSFPAATARPGAPTSTTACPSTTTTRCAAAGPWPATSAPNAANTTCSKPSTTAPTAGKTNNAATAPSNGPHPPAASTAAPPRAPNCSPTSTPPAPPRPAAAQPPPRQNPTHRPRPRRPGRQTRHQRRNPADQPRPRPRNRDAAMAQRSPPQTLPPQRHPQHQPLVHLGQRPTRKRNHHRRLETTTPTPTHRQRRTTLLNHPSAERG